MIKIHKRGRMKITTRPLRKPLAKATKKYVKKSIKLGKELKQLGIGDISTTQNAVNALSVWEAYANTTGNSLTNIGQADNDFSRDGDKITLDYCDVMLKINFPSLNPLVATYAETLNSRCIRILFVQLRLQSTVADVLAVLNTTLVAGDITPLRNNNKFLRFCHLLKDITIYEKHKEATVTNTAGANVSIPSETVMRRFRLKPKMETLEWLTASTTAVIPDVRGAICACILAKSNDSGAASGAITAAQSAHYSYNVVTRFRDH
nr:MAG TPA: capsid protein [Bacteriophage sp.]